MNGRRWGADRRGHGARRACSAAAGDGGESVYWPIWRQHGLTARRAPVTSDVVGTHAHRITSWLRGTRSLALSPKASRALAVGNAEQAASRSNAAGQDPVIARRA